MTRMSASHPWGTSLALARIKQPSRSKSHAVIRKGESQLVVYGTEHHKAKYYGSTQTKSVATQTTSNANPVIQNVITIHLNENPKKETVENPKSNKVSDWQPLMVAGIGLGAGFTMNEAGDQIHENKHHRDDENKNSKKDKTNGSNKSNINKGKK